MTLMSNIAIKYIVSALARVCCALCSNLCCAYSLRMMLLEPGRLVVRRWRNTGR